MCKLRRQFPRTQSCNGSVQPVSSCKLRQTRVQQQIPCTVQLKSVGALAHGETLSAAILFSSNFPQWDENHNLGKDENERRPWLTWPGLWITVKAIIMWNVSHRKIIGPWGLVYWSSLIFETKETKSYSNTTASYSLQRYFWPQKNEVKLEFSKKSDKVLPKSDRRYKLRFHHGSIAKNVPILSSGTVSALTRQIVTGTCYKTESQGRVPWAYKWRHCLVTGTVWFNTCLVYFLLGHRDLLHNQCT